jgi:hypothetical protein
MYDQLNLEIIFKFSKKTKRPTNFDELISYKLYCEKDPPKEKLLGLNFIILWIPWN